MIAGVSSDKCNGCGNCVEVCPVEAISMDKNKEVVIDEYCVEGRI